MTRLARRLRSALALVAAAAVVVLSPGLEAPRLFAQVVVRTAPVEGVSPVVGYSGAPPAALANPAPALTMTAPSLAAPSIFAAAPNAAAALAPAAAAASTPAPARAASVPEIAAALAPHLEAASKPDAGADGAFAAGRGIENVLTGQRSAGSGGVAAVAGAESSDVPALAPSAAASAPSDSSKPAVPAAAAAAAVKTVDSAVSYRVQRLMLRTVAALTGGVFSLPSAGPVLTDKLIASAADKSVVLSDYDDTLASYKTVLPADMVSAVQAVRAAGKDFAVISDRGDEPKPGELTVFQSLESIPVETRVGMYVAANSGGRVYRYDEKGEPVRLFEAPTLSGDQKAKAAEAIEAMKARIKEIGVEQHYPSAANSVPNESWNTYSYALMLKIGSNNAQVKGATAILQEELSKRGFDVEVNPRFAKDPANPPYITFSLITKKTAAAYIAKALNAEAKDVLVIGDSMYTPSAAKKESWLTRLGASLSGRVLPTTGNRTDANMQKALPGALTFSVGTSGDPRQSNLWVLDGKGPAVTRRVLMSVASKKRGDAGLKAIDVIAPVALIAAVAAAYYFLINGIADGVASWEQSIQRDAHDAIQNGGLFGGILGLGGVAAKIPARWKENAKKVLPVVGVAALIAAAAAGFYVMLHAFGEVFGAGASQMVPTGGDPLLGLTLGAAGAYGYGAAARALSNPADAYGEARKKALEIAAARGAAASEVRFVEATASMPVRDGAHWHYAFEIPGVKGGTALVYVDTSRFLGGALDARASVHENAPSPAGKLAAALESAPFSMGTKRLDPESALALARKAQPGMSGGVSVSLDYREEPVSGDKDLWYRFYDDGGAAVSVNARTTEVRVDQALPSKASLRASVSPASPIEGFSSFVYAEALTAARAHAVSIGYKPDNLRVTSARLSPRPWGEDWTFTFVAPREDAFKEPRAFELSVRRTMVAETLVDAYGLKDLGRSPLFVGFSAAKFPEFVKVSPMDVVAKSGDAARTLEVLARWTGHDGEPELWYVVRGDKGRELAAYNAKTGEKDETDRWAGAKAALFTLGALAFTAGLYAAIFYAISHAPAAQSPDEFVPVPSGTGFDSLFGGTLGLIAASGTLRSIGGKKKVSDDEIEAAAKSAISYKGGIWSQTEYNMGYSNSIENLTKRGATKAQIARFKKLCDEAPVAGGRFNPWSGD